MRVGFADIRRPFHRLQTTTSPLWDVSDASLAQFTEHTSALQTHGYSPRRIEDRGATAHNSMADADADQTLDVLGFHCPVPVHETKRTLSTMDVGEILLVMADDPETRIDIPALLNRSGDTLLGVGEEAGEYHYRIRKETKP